MRSRCSITAQGRRAATIVNGVIETPLLKIAENRADYYADDPDTTREEEIEYALSDRGSEALDWYLNNMNFSDISEFAVLVDVPKVKDEPGDDAECDVVELPAAHARAMCAPGMQEGV